MRETVPLDFVEDEIMWVAPKIPGAAGALVAEAIEPINWLLHFSCSLDELRVVFVRLADWMANFSLSWADYCAIMACRLVVLYKRSDVYPWK